MVCVQKFRKKYSYIWMNFSFYFPIELFYSVKIVYYVEIKRCKDKAREV